MSLTKDMWPNTLQDADGILVPGGFGDRGIRKARSKRFGHARENDVPFLGICLECKWPAWEFARNVVGLEMRIRAETDPDTATKHH